jgi:DNA (cytosine-5)-methyltransferase 1
MDDVGHPEELPTVLSLCTGYGGIERGLELAGLKHRVLAHVEIEAFAIANLVAKMEQGRLDAAPIWTNLKTLPVDCFRDRVSILTSGYPCQPFSAAGKRAGKDDPRHLWPYIVDIIKAVRPIRCFFENVEGHISLGLREVIEDLEGLGYSTAWGIFSAVEVGAPHQRKRVFILANADGAGLQTLRNQSGAERQASVVGESGELADTSGERSQGSQRLGPSREARIPRGHAPECSDQLADSVSPRSQAGLSGQERPNQEGDSGVVDNGSGEQGGWTDGMPWAIEPNVGRVVDGATDRVDRLRLLGNGVVPQTAAKAWRVLAEELDDRRCRGDLWD